MVKHLLHLSECSLEVSSNLNIIDRLDDSLSAIQMSTEEDISTESSALLRAIGIQNERGLVKDTVLYHLDAIQNEVAKEIFLSGRNLESVLKEVVRVTKDTTLDINAKIPTRNKASIDYLLSKFDTQTIQVNDRVCTLDQFIKESHRLSDTLKLLGGKMYPLVSELISTNMETVDKGAGTALLSNIPNNQSLLNNATLSYKKDIVSGWKFQFNIKRRDVKETQWVVGSRDTLFLKEALKSLVGTLDEVVDTIEFTAILDEYKKDRRANRRKLELIYRFYVPMIITQVRVIYLIIDILNNYIHENEG